MPTQGSLHPPKGMLTGRENLKKSLSHQGSTKTVAKLMNIVLESAYIKTLTMNVCEYVCEASSLANKGSGALPF